MEWQKFSKAYAQLSEQQKAILHLKALVYFPISTETLRTCFYNLKHLFTTKVHRDHQEFKSALSGLQSCRLIGRNGQLSNTVIHFLTIEALRCEYAEHYLKSITHTSEKMGLRFYQSYPRREEELNALRLALYQNKEKDFLKAAENYTQTELIDFLKRLFLIVPLEIDWLKTRPLAVQQLILHLKIYTFCLSGELASQISDLLTHYLPLRTKKEYRTFDQVFLLYDILTANLKTAEQTLKALEGNLVLSKSRQGMFAVVAGDEKAFTYFEDALKICRQLIHKKKALLETPETLFQILALLLTKNRADYNKIQTILNLVNEHHWHKPHVFNILQMVIWRLQGMESKIRQGPLKGHYDSAPLSSAIGILADYWFESEAIDLGRCKREYTKYKNLLPIVAKIFAEILHKKEPANKEYAEYLSQDLFKGIISFIDIVQMGERWQCSLDHLQHFFEKQGGFSSKDSKRLVWFFDPQSARVEPIEQSLQKNGTWSKGRPIALKRLYDLDPKFEYLTDEDKRVIKTLSYERSRGWYGHNEFYEWDRMQMPLSLIGHPRVYDIQNPEQRLEFISASPELVIKHQEDDKFHVSLSHMSYEPKVYIEQETATRFKVVEFPESLLPLAEILSFSGIEVPETAKDHLIALIQKASPFLPIHSELEVMDIPVQEGDITSCLQIVPLEQGLKMNLYVRPFKDQGPYFRPGHGRTFVLIYDESQPHKAHRFLEAERKAANAVIEGCQYFKQNEDGSDEWIIGDPQDCLETLSDLQEMRDAVRIEWPEGQRLAVTRPSSFDHLSLKITQQQDWLSVGGSLKVDEETIIDFQRLLGLLDQAQGRFIPIAENKFITLTNHLKKQLQDLKALTTETKDGHQLHTFGSFILKSLTDKVRDVEADKSWKNMLKAYRELETYQPELPNTLQAELRDYQRVGFEWLSRLSHLGVGACLADDMGLGKTLQALAVMLAHAPSGPCLVIAPTSVCHNWVSEIEKFAPALTAHTLKDSKRDELVSSLKAMDVLICSYSLLQQEEDLLTSKAWEMIVLDEAQAIKNATTKRFQSAIKLQGNFKLALTGTPIENNLEEIWSLFRFIAPGLLGSRDAFQKRFIISSGKEKDQNKQAALKSVIQMFILRRTKKAVLQELPSRTEKTILVDMTSEETAFYEALRRQALDNLSSLEEAKGQRKIHILAEITRLRRFCCHSILAQKDVLLPSSKLRVFFHLVEELLQNNHQALVFSQYVGYLQLVRQELDHRGISYQYLDGSTPASERIKQVQDFQEGKSSLFLLSLKAGGTGLNLTAADYVIHLDPWWNPAVEDQASDRAHRLGQTRPVTIYRLILQHTIEERILQLHKQKREMADELLEGTHYAEKMSEEDLLKLIDGSSSSNGHEENFSIAA